MVDLVLERSEVIVAVAVLTSGHERHSKTTWINALQAATECVFTQYKDAWRQYAPVHQRS
jgi:hypothetical protein